MDDFFLVKRLRMITRSCERHSCCRQERNEAAARIEALEKALREVLDEFCNCDKCKIARYALKEGI